MKEVRNFQPSDILHGQFDNSSDSYPYWSSSWEQRISQFIDAPWTDIEGRYFILTLPVSTLQTFSTIELKELIEFWDQVVFNELELSGDIIDYDFTTERLTCDQQISAGYMHSGYPVMCFTDIITSKVEGIRPQLLNLPQLKTQPFWGIYHEIGHNRQKSAWTWKGMTEVTVNIFSLYNCWMMNGQKAFQTNWYITQIPNQIKYLKSENSTYNDYIADAGVALGAFAVYIDVIAKDWDVVKNIFQIYRTQKINPISDNDKINEWIKQTSQAVGMDLRSYYQQWKWPINNSYLSDIDGLPEWSGDVADILEQSQS